MLIAFMGLPGSGKTTLIRRVAPLLGAAVLDKDAVRAAVFGSRVDYSAAQDDLVMGMLFQAAGYLLGRDPRRPVILDGRVFSRPDTRTAFIACAEKIGTPWRVIHVVCREDVALQRLEHDRAAGLHAAGNRDAALYFRLQAEFAPLDLPHLTLDTSAGDLDALAAAVVEYLQQAC